MAADYARILGSFWTDPDIKRPLPPEQKCLLLYYFSSPLKNLTGLYHCPFIYVADQTGLPIEKIEEWTRGPLSKFVTYDAETEEVFVHKLAQHQVGYDLKPTDKKRVALLKTLDEAHSTRLVDRFHEVYKHWPLSDNEGASKPLGSPSEAINTALTPDNDINTAQHRGSQGAPDGAGKLAGLNEEELKDWTARAVQACNEGLKANPLIRKKLRPLSESGRWNRHAIETLSAEGVSLQTIITVVREGAEAYEPAGDDSQIRSLGYFTARVLAEHRRRTALETDTGSVPGTAATKAKAAAEARETADYSTWRERVLPRFREEPDAVREEIEEQAKEVIGPEGLRAIPAGLRDRSLEAEVLKIYGRKINDRAPTDIRVAS